MTEIQIFKKINNYSERKKYLNTWYTQDECVYIFTINNMLGSLREHVIDKFGGVTPSVLITGVDEKGNKKQYHQFIMLADWDGLIETNK